MQELFATSPTAFITVAFLFSLLVGSFLNVVIYRLPVMLEREWLKQCRETLSAPPAELPEEPFNLMVPRSRCPSCSKQITALQNIPVLSYLLLRGKCANCQARISLRYPVIEFSTALLTAAVAWRFGFGWEAFAATLLTWSFIAISVIDFDHQIIPDSISLPLVWIGLALSLFHPVAGADVLFIEPKTAIIGALAGYLSLWSVYQLFKMLTGKEGMGYGDFKMLAVIGAWLGWQMILPVVLFSAIVGAVTGILLIVIQGRDRSTPIPFGPYLAAAGWIAMMWGDAIVAGYLDYMG
jgi:leader peptidase (prepilin peptidase)/N-methyltransferase